MDARADEKVAEHDKEQECELEVDDDYLKPLSEPECTSVIVQDVEQDTASEIEERWCDV